MFQKIQAWDGISFVELKDDLVTFLQTEALLVVQGLGKGVCSGDRPRSFEPVHVAQLW